VALGFIFLVKRKSSDKFSASFESCFYRITPKEEGRVSKAERAESHFKAFP